MFHRIALVAALVIAHTRIVHADDLDPSLAIYDKPLSIQTVPPKSDTDPTGELRCTFYPDMMIREIDIAEPDAGPAAIIPGSFPPSASSCARLPLPRQVVAQTATYIFLGRKGSYLLFAFSDPDGAEPFEVLAAASGRTLYSDAFNGNDVESLTLQNGNLNLRFVRGVDGTCSLIQTGIPCWNKFLKTSSLPAIYTTAPPPFQHCTQDYQAAHLTPDTYTILTYDVDMIISTTVKSHVLTRGPLGCAGEP